MPRRPGRRGIVVTLLLGIVLAVCGGGAASTVKPFTVHTADVPGAGTVHWGLAETTEHRTGVPLVLYIHGNEGSADQFATLPAWKPLRERLIDGGWAWAEGTGGGGTTLGNDASRAAYEATYTFVASQLDIGPVVILGRSGGAVTAQWLLTESPVLSPVTDGAIISSGVQDLAAWYDAAHLRATALAAYGAHDRAEYLASIAGHNPIDWPASRWHGKRILQIVGDDDDLVPAQDHGLAIRAHYRGEPVEDLLTTRVGGDHTTENGTYAEVDSMWNFLQSVAARNRPAD